jgi:hypothetical protein
MARVVPQNWHRNITSLLSIYNTHLHIPPHTYTHMSLFHQSLALHTVLTEDQEQLHSATSAWMQRAKDSDLAHKVIHVWNMPVFESERLSVQGVCVRE